MTKKATRKKAAPKKAAAKKTTPKEPETPGALLKRTINSIRTTQGMDTELLNILAEKVLALSTPMDAVPAPVEDAIPAAVEDAVADAVEAIEALAVKRAAEAGDDGSDQD